MEELKNKIIKEGKTIGTDIVKVDSFLNHQLDVRFLEKVGKEFFNRFDGVKIDRILTVEASGIAIACLAAPYFGYPPVTFAKKTTPNTMDESCYEAEAKSFTKGTVSRLKVAKTFLQRDENVLILDDFLASGQASIALADIVEQAGAKVAGIGAVVEKKHQGGSDILRGKGYKVESLAVIERIKDGMIIFE